MSAGKINLQANDGAVIGLVVPDGLTSGERQIALGTNLSSVASYHLLQGNLAVSNSTITQGFNTKLYTGNGSTQSINTGIDMDTQWGSTAEEKFGGLVWNKNRGVANNHYLFDTIRGVTNHIRTDGTNAQAALANSLTAFNSSGFTLGSEANNNTSANNYASWNFQTTHRISGVTNHGKAYTCHYNPFTGFTIVKYEGSGLAGHEIPHHLGRKLGFVTVKNLSAVAAWGSSYEDGTYLLLNATDAKATNTDFITKLAKDSLIIGANITGNVSTNQYIMYGWANSYFDESNKLIGNYEIGVYQGTGVAGNKVKTRGKPAWVMVKRVDSAGDWATFDNQRGLGLGTNAKYILPNSSNVEGSSANTDMSFVSDGFIVGNTTTGANTSGGQYIALVAYDTNSNGGGSYYPLASDTANVQVNNALIPLAKGIDSNGVKNSIVVANETITGVTYTAGKNYLYKTDTGYGVKPYEPRYLKSELVRKFAGEQPDYYDVESNKWFNTDAGSELITNGTFVSNTTGWTASSGCIITFSNGMMSINRNSQASSIVVYQDISGLTIGKKYKLSSYVANGTMTSGTMDMHISNTDYTNDNIVYAAYGTPQKLSIDFIATNTTMRVSFGQSSPNAGAVSYVDNISVFATDITPTTEITESRNYMNHIVHADNDGGVLYVEELPKIEYKDVIKANEFKGKNACTAWVNFDGTTTPPTIRDSYNVSNVVRTATGVYDVYFATPMDNSNYSTVIARNIVTTGDTMQVGQQDVLKVNVRSHTPASPYAINASLFNIQIFGGSN